MRRMTETADAIVVGAGVQGASLAFHLSTRGLRTVVLEAGTLAGGATGRSSGLVRMHYDLEPEARLAWASFPWFREWDRRVGGDCGFVRTGFLQLMSREDEPRLRENVAMQQRIGIPTLLVGADDVRRLAPDLSTDDVDVAAYEPESGYADPTATAAGFMAAARRRGATLVPGCRVIGIATAGGRVVGVQTTRGSFAAPIVVDAAGAWAGGIGRLVGLELPLGVWRHDVAFVRRPERMAPGLPTVIDDGNAMYFRPEGRELVLVALEDGNAMDSSPDRETDSVADDFVERAVERICRRIPGMIDGELHSTHSGQDGITPDQRPILGPAGPEGFFLDCGFSGTGFKTAPAVGAAMAEWIVEGRAASVDITPFALRRFAEGRPLGGERGGRTIWR